MKKLLTILLVMVMAFSLVTPALAAQTSGLFGDGGQASTQPTGKALLSRKTTVYSGPDAASKVLGTLYTNETVEVTDYYDQWAQIIWGGRSRGYVLADNLDFNPVKRYESTNALVLRNTNVFKKASDSSNVLGYFTKGQDVKVVNIVGDFAEIMWYGWNTAFVAVADLSIKGTVPVNDSGSTTPAPTPATATAQARQNTNVRTGPGTSYKKIGLIKKGETVQVKDSSDKKWLKISFSGKDAYVYKSYFTTVKVPATPPTTDQTKGYSGTAAYNALKKAGFFDMYSSICLGCYTDNNDILVVRMVSNANVDLLMEEVTRILKGSAANIKIARSSMASTVTPAYIRDIIKLARGNYNKLRLSDKTALGVAYWGYDPRSDSFRVGLATNDKATRTFFKTNVLDWEYTSFERAVTLTADDKAFLSAPNSSPTGANQSSNPDLIPGTEYWGNGKWTTVESSLFGSPKK